MIVYIVEIGSYDARAISGVFSSLEKAKDAWKADDWILSNGEWYSSVNEANISKWELDKES